MWKMGKEEGDERLQHQRKVTVLKTYEEEKSDCRWQHLFDLLKEMWEKKKIIELHSNGCSRSLHRKQCVHHWCMTFERSALVLASGSRWKPLGTFLHLTYFWFTADWLPVGYWWTVALHSVVYTESQPSHQGPLESGEQAFQAFPVIKTEHCEVT